MAVPMPMPATMYPDLGHDVVGQDAAGVVLDGTRRSTP